MLKTVTRWVFTVLQKNVDDNKMTMSMFYNLHHPDNSGWNTLWRTYKKELWVGAITEYRSTGDVISCLKSMGLKYEEHDIPNSFDITECFNPSSQTGTRLLNYLTAREQFYQSFTPEIRAGILDHLRNKCSTEKDGRIMFNSNLSCIVIYA